MVRVTMDGISSGNDVGGGSRLTSASRASSPFSNMPADATGSADVNKFGMDKISRIDAILSENDRMAPDIASFVHAILADDVGKYPAA